MPTLRVLGFACARLPLPDRRRRSAPAAMGGAPGALAAGRAKQRRWLLPVADARPLRMAKLPAQPSPRLADQWQQPMTTRHTLDPKLDVVFKLLFAKPSNKRLLIALLTAILEPALPIADVEVLNPDVTKDSVETKGSVLDLLVSLADGRRVNLEMQSTAQGWSMPRGLFYCARVYASQLSRGDDYSELNAVVGIFILDFKALRGERYHSAFELLEVHTHARLTQHLAIHVIELPKLPEVVPAMNVPAVLKWSKFLAARDDQELERVAMSDPDLREAKTALEELSQDPTARRLAEERRLAALNYRLSMAQERKEGREEGREEGRTETLRSSIEQVCRMLGIALTETRRACLHAATPDEAQAIFDHLTNRQAWPG